jgi:hypothetical protein
MADASASFDNQAVANALTRLAALGRDSTPLMATIGTGLVENVLLHAI